MSLNKIIIFILFAAYLGIGVYHSTLKPLPEYVHFEGQLYFVPDESVQFLSDETYLNTDGERIITQSIFDQVFAMIENAQEYILIDMFLFNDFQGKTPETHKLLSKELTDVLVYKKNEDNTMVITFVTDPINTVYGGQSSQYLDELSKAGVFVIETNLQSLRDSNPLYSSLWRMGLQWFGNNNNGGFMPHPFQHSGYFVTVRSYLELLNFKANHRKLIVTDDGSKMSTLVTSANPHDGSSAHGNVALKIDDFIWRDAVLTEQAVGNMSYQPILAPELEVTDETGRVGVQLLTEGAIKNALLRTINSAEAGDGLDIAVFYLSDRDIVTALKEADTRGVEIRLLLDANKDAFSREKNGVPNRPVAYELQKNNAGNLTIRWCETHGEQCHAKMLLLEDADADDVLILGSANFTRRNLGDYNLETNVLVLGDEAQAIKDASAYFDRIWENQEGRVYSVSYPQYAEEGYFKTFLYHVMERTGLSTF